MDISVWLALVGLFFAGGLTPGPAVMMVVAAALRYGVRSALIAAVGVSAANLIWITLAVSGAAALAARFPLAFSGLKLAGLGFVFWLTWRMATQTSAASLDKTDAPKAGHLFGAGVGLQLANPNALIFFGLLLPAYLDPERHLVWQAALIMATVTATEMIGLTVYALGADGLSRRFASARFARRFGQVAALTMAGAAVYGIFATGL